MVLVSLRCPFCGSEKVSKNGHNHNKQRYLCNNPECGHQTFYEEYSYNGCKPKVKQDIIKWSIDGAGIRATARGLGVSTDTVMSALKKKRTCSSM